MPISRVTVGTVILLVASAPASAATHSVAAGGDLQAAINAAQPGDVIQLQAGATFVGNFVLPVKSGSSYITIRTSTPDASLPGADVRISPASAALLAKLQSPNSAPALETAPGAHHYRLMFLEFGPNAGGFSEILRLGDGSSAQNTLASVPYELVLDRIYVHGDPITGQKRCIALNTATTTIVNSYIAECKAVGQDAQAIAGWNGPGPYTIVNNYLEAAGENVLFGGADPGIANLVVSDITFRSNYVTKPLTWRGSNWQVKNLFELKNAQRVVIDGNLFENNWQAAQAGYAIVFTPRNQDGTAPWSVVQHVQFTNNIVRHVSSAINILGNDNEHPSQTTNDIVIRNNLFTDVSAAAYGGEGRFLLINGGANITVDRNTVREDGSSVIVAYDRPTVAFTFTNNIVPDNNWAIMGADESPGNGTVARYFSGGVILNNVIAGAPINSYPAGNYYPASLNSVGFVSLTNGDYHLASTSPYRASATDGGPLGCNVDALPSDTIRSSSTVTATPSSTPPPPPPPTPPPPPPAPPSAAPSSAPASAPAASSAPEPAPAATTMVVVSTEPTYEIPPPPGSYGFSDHGYYRPTGGWQETRMIAPAGNTLVRGDVPQTFVAASAAPTYEIPPPPGSYGFSDHGYYRPTGGWQETRMTSPGVSSVVTAAAAPGSSTARAPQYATPAPAGSYGFTDHGYFRPDGGWTESTLVAAPAAVAAGSRLTQSVAVSSQQTAVAVGSRQGSQQTTDAVASQHTAVLAGSWQAIQQTAEVVGGQQTAVTAGSRHSSRQMADAAGSGQPAPAGAVTLADRQTQSVVAPTKSAQPALAQSDAPRRAGSAPLQLLWSVAPQPNVTLYQWWMLVNDQWTLVKDWSPSNSYAQTYDATRPAPQVGVVMR